jgi:hypothetical protein
MKETYPIFIQKSVPLGAFTYLLLTGIAILVRQLPSFDLDQLVYILFIGCPIIALVFGFVSKAIGIEFLPTLITGGIVFSTFLVVQYNVTAAVYIPVHLALISVGYSLAAAFQRLLST